MRTIAIVNQKGGSGKTTTTVNLAAALSEQKRNVLVIDLDVQRNATIWLGSDSHETGIYEVVVEKGSISNHIQETGFKNISIVPATTALGTAEVQLARKKNRVFFNLRDQVRAIEGQFNYVLMDCPPNLGFMTANALAASKEIIIPVETNVLALIGVLQLLETFESVTQKINPKLQITGVLACRVNKQTRQARDAIQALRKRFKGDLFRTVIRQNVRLSECPGFRQPINIYDPRCNGTKDYRALAKEVIKQEKGI